MKVLSGRTEEYDGLKKELCSEPYGAAIVRYAERWADLMEKDFSGGNIRSLSEETSWKAGRAGITRTMHGRAAEILIKFWQHGIDLHYAAMFKDWIA